MGDAAALLPAGVTLGLALLCLVVAFAASVIGGLAGYGTGLLMPLVLVPLVGPEPVVPIIGVTALFTNGGRVVAFRQDVDWGKAWRVLLLAVPFTILGTWLYDALSGRGVLFLLGVTLLAMVPLRRWLKSRAFLFPEAGLVPFGAGLGLLMGGTTGSGVLLVSVLMATGISGASVVATDAAISIVTGLVKSGSFAALGALTPQLVFFSVLIGCATFPGGYIARWMIARLSVKLHMLLLEGAVVIGALMLLWRAIAG